MVHVDISTYTVDCIMAKIGEGKFSISGVQVLVEKHTKPTREIFDIV